MTHLCVALVVLGFYAAAERRRKAATGVRPSYMGSAATAAAAPKPDPQAPFDDLLPLVRDEGIADSVPERLVSEVLPAALLVVGDVGHGMEAALQSSCSHLLPRPCRHREGGDHNPSCPPTVDAGAGWTEAGPPAHCGGAGAHGEAMR